MHVDYGTAVVGEELCTRGFSFLFFLCVFFLFFFSFSAFVRCCPGVLGRREGAGVNNLCGCMIIYFPSVRSLASVTALRAARYSAHVCRTTMRPRRVYDEMLVSCPGFGRSRLHTPSAGNVDVVSTLPSSFYHDNLFPPFR